MKRILYLLILSCFICVCASAQTIIPKGIILKGYARAQIDSAVIQTGDKVSFINPADVWVGEYNFLPKSSIFYGEIEDLKMPVRGVNAAMKIKIYKIVTPENIVYPISGHVISKGKTQLGGDLAPPLSYNKMPHRTTGFRLGALQYVPSGEYAFGEHIKIPAGSEVQIMLETELRINN